MTKKTRTHEEQEIRQSVRLELAFRAELLLHGLVTDILAGNTSHLTDFQQLIQYAPPEMKDRIAALLK